MALLITRILLMTLPVLLLIWWLRKRAKSGGGADAKDLVPVAFGILGVFILLLVAIKISGPGELSPRLDVTKIEQSQP